MESAVCQILSVCIDIAVDKVMFDIDIISTRKAKWLTFFETYSLFTVTYTCKADVKPLLKLISDKYAQVRRISSCEWIS